MAMFRSNSESYPYKLKEDSIDRINSQGYIVDLNKKPILDHKGRKIFVPEEYRRYYKEV
tara:strand:+ start:302 stop:478 length:177 start_codon:yes stop_codon:yes gene_type:complete